MAYEPTNWQAGDIVTSAKLNKIEQGIAAGGGVLVVHANEEGALDKTWQEIYDADVCFVNVNDDGVKAFYYISTIQNDNNTYIVSFFAPNDVSAITFISSSPDDYPTINNSEEGGSGNLSAS